MMTMKEEWWGQGVQGDDHIRVILFTMTNDGQVRHWYLVFWKLEKFFFKAMELFFVVFLRTLAKLLCYCAQQIFSHSILLRNVICILFYWQKFNSITGTREQSETLEGNKVTNQEKNKGIWEHWAPPPPPAGDPHCDNIWSHFKVRK